METEIPEPELPAPENDFPLPEDLDNIPVDITEMEGILPSPPPELYDDDDPPPDYDTENDSKQSVNKLKEPSPHKTQCPDLVKVEEPGKLFKDVSLGEAVEKVLRLLDIVVTDPQPSIEGSFLAIQYLVNFDTNFGDRNAYITGNAKFLEEATVHSDLVIKCSCI